MDSSFKNTQLVKLVLSIEKLTKKIDKLNNSLEKLNKLEKLDNLDNLSELIVISNKLDDLNTKFIEPEGNWNIASCIKSIYNKM